MFDSYLNAPATKMLASHCACCSKPLGDAVSVNLGIGPICRKLHGFDITVDESARAEANKIVHEIAANQTGPEVCKLTNRLVALGFATLADRIVKRLEKAAKKAEEFVVKVEEKDGFLFVKSPFSQAFNDAVRSVPGARWHATEKVRSAPVASRGALWQALKAGYGPGTLVVGTKAVATL